MPEGTIFFPNEPIVQVKAPIAEAQIIETRIINILHFQILIASKAARVTLAAQGRPVVDFGLRRAHGAEAGLFASRASYIAGLSGSSTVLSGMAYGVPTFGTMAHSFVQAHESELDAFLAFGRSQPDNVVLLIDTYDLEQGVRNAVRAAQELAREGIQVRGVRIDSGDLALQSRMVRSVLDEHGLHEVRIIVSGNLDENAIEGLVRSKAPIDGFGVGTRMDTSSDVPYLDCAYKLQEYMGQPKMKTSPGKSTLPGRKQVYRRYHDDGTIESDLIALWNETVPEATSLLEPVLEHGQITQPLPSLEAARNRFLKGLESLPTDLKSLSPAVQSYLVEISDSLSEQLKNSLPGQAT